MHTICIITLLLRTRARHARAVQVVCCCEGKTEKGCSHLAVFGPIEAPGLAAGPALVHIIHVLPKADQFEVALLTLVMLHGEVNLELVLHAHQSR